MKKKIIFLAAFLLIIVLASGTFIRVRYGGGQYYQDVSTDPLLGRMNIESVYAHDAPLGNIAVSQDNRIFFTVHPESRPTDHKLLEVINGVAYPFPDENLQDTHFNTVLGLFIDGYDRLWTIDHGNHGQKAVRLLGFDLNTGQIVHDYVFPPEVAPLGSFFNDLQVSDEGIVYIADASILGKNPAIVVYDIAAGVSRRLLEGHESVVAQDWVIRHPTGDVKLLLGLFSLRPGVDGLVLDSDGEYLYFAAMAHDGLYKISTAALNNPEVSAAALEQQVARVGTKPLSDGLSIDTLDNVYITDVEHGGIAMLSKSGQIVSLIKDPELVRWADGCSFGGDGRLYFTDSALPHQLLQSKSHMEKHGPYYIYRIQTGIGGVPGR